MVVVLGTAVVVLGTAVVVLATVVVVDGIVVDALASSARSGSDPRPDDDRRDRQQHERHGQRPTEPRPHSGHVATHCAPTDAGAGQRCLTTSTMRVPASVGFWPICTPAAWSASCLAAAVPLPPDTMAPAWPIFLPGGAVTPAM